MNSKNSPKKTTTKKESFIKVRKYNLKTQTLTKKNIRRVITTTVTTYPKKKKAVAPRPEPIATTTTTMLDHLDQIDFLILPKDSDEIWGRREREDHNPEIENIDVLQVTQTAAASRGKGSASTGRETAGQIRSGTGTLYGGEQDWVLPPGWYRKGNLQEVDEG